MTYALRPRAIAMFAAVVLAALLVMGSCGYPGREASPRANCITCHG